MTKITKLLQMILTVACLALTANVNAFISPEPFIAPLFLFTPIPQFISWLPLPPFPIKAGYSTPVGMNAYAQDSVPVLTIDSAPVGFALVSQSGFLDTAGHATVRAKAVYNATRDQIGLHSVVYRATTPAGSTTYQRDYNVIDAPQPVTNLVAVKSTNKIALTWTPGVGGVAPLTFVVTACYPNGYAPPNNSGCDKYSTTALGMSIPSTPPHPVLAAGFRTPNYNSVSVTPIDAAGTGVGSPSLDVSVTIP